MEALAAKLPAILKTCVTLLVFAIGLGSTLADLTSLWRRPGLLLRSLLAMYVLVPLAALAAIRLVPEQPGVKAALLVLAVSAGAPLLPRKLSKLVSGAYSFSLVVLTSVLAIVLVPAWIELLGRHFDRDVAVPPMQVAAVIGKAFLLPLAVGMLLRWFAPQFGERASEVLMKIVGIAMTLAAVALLAGSGAVLAQIDLRGMFTLVLLMALALAIGHLLGGPEEDDRTTLAVACATRHVGIAILVASAFPGTNTIVMMAAYAIASAIVSIPYLVWRRKVAASRA